MHLQEYIEGLLKKGYSEADIIYHLAKSGYTQEEARRNVEYARLLVKKSRKKLWVSIGGAWLLLVAIGVIFLAAGDPQSVPSAPSTSEQAMDTLQIATTADPELEPRAAIACTPDAWRCTSFGECRDGVSLRSCTLINRECLDALAVKPLTSQACVEEVVVMECTPGEAQRCGETSTGACNRGEQVCSASGEWGLCIGEVGPSNEVCDDIDNDCDGSIDEGLQCTIDVRIESLTLTSPAVVDETLSVQTVLSSTDTVEVSITWFIDGVEVSKKALSFDDEQSEVLNILPSQETTTVKVTLEPKASNAESSEKEITFTAQYRCDSVLQTNPCEEPDTSEVVQDESTEVKIVSLRYFPVVGLNLDSSVVGFDASLSSIRSKVDTMEDQTLTALTEGSRYRGYKDSSAQPSITYSVMQSHEFLKAMPLSDNQVPWNPNAYRPDYRKMLTEDIDVCNYVDGQGVREIWVWGYHYGATEPVESNMAMGTVSSSYFNMGSYGDVSNSERTDDLPVCEHTYTLYNYNYHRTAGESTHNHGHQIENLLDWADQSLFRNEWTGSVQGHVVTNAGCGDVHHPPNSVVDYDYKNSIAKDSDCENWNPQRNGAKTSVSCEVWGCSEDGGLSYYVWWMQNLPGMDNGLTYEGEQMRNWWELKADFDTAAQKGKKLTS